MHKGEEMLNQAQENATETQATSVRVKPGIDYEKLKSIGVPDEVIASLDPRDGGNHLNNRGARKCTMFLGDYLSRNYELTDRRTDKSFSLWNRDYDEYRKKVKI